MNNENKNPNVEEELKKQSQEAAENEQTTSEASEAQENASSEEKELTAEESWEKNWKKLRKSSTSRKTNTYVCLLNSTTSANVP